jgi:hypothetical protein
MPRQQWRGGGPSMSQMDRTAFAKAVLEVLETQGDVASEATWQKLSQVIAEYWLVFQTDQSPVSTWTMLTKCTETVLKIRAYAKVDKGTAGADALEEFRGFMQDVLGDEHLELPEK